MLWVVRWVLIFSLFGMGRLCLAQADLSLHGYVLDPTGAAVPGVPVRLETPEGKPVEQTTSEAKGEFTLSGLSRGNFESILPA